VLPRFRGTIEQRVPDYAAVKVDGERLYARARRGERVEAPTRAVTIHALELVADRGDGRLELEVHCSAGTYIRALAADIGAAVGCGAYCEELRRTHVGELSVADALPPEDAVAAGGRDPLEGLAHVPALEVGAAARAEVAHGRPLAGGARGRVLLVHEGELVAVAEGDGARIRPRVVLAAAGSGGE